MTATNEDSSQPSAAPSESEPLSTDTPPPNSSSEHASSPSSSPTPPTPTPDRSELLDRARLFLSSPQVTHQDYESKRRFLTEKGLADGEIRLLLREMVRPIHAFVPLRFLRPQNSCLCSRKAFAVPRRSTADISCASAVPSARPSRRHLQGALMASGWLHGSALHILRACTHTISSLLPPLRPGQPWPTSDSCFRALRGRHSPVARSRHTKATLSLG
jgi:hypothetical protein